MCALLLGNRMIWAVKRSAETTRSNDNEQGHVNQMGLRSVSWGMSRLFVVMLLLTVACSTGAANQITTTTTESVSTTTTPAQTSTSTPAPVSAAGHLVKLDPLTLEPVPDLDPIPMGADSWNMLSTDGSMLVNFEWDAQARINYGRTFDVDEWKQVGEFEVGPHSGRVVHEATLYAYDHENGRLLARDVGTGHESTLGDWPSGLWLWDDLHVLSEYRVAALGTGPTDSSEQAEYSVFVYEPVSRVTREFPVGAIERINERSRVFDGDYEIPEVDSPGVAWDDDRVFIVHADGPEVVEIDIQTGAIETHTIEVTSLWDRLWAFWMPAASAKGPSLGTNSSAALSHDGRYLFISGNRQVVDTADDGGLIDESEHLGLTVVDTETWQTVDSPDVPIQFVREVTGSVLGVDTTSIQPWVSDHYLLSIDESGTVVSRGPFTVAGGGCALTPDQGYLLCSEHGSSGIHIQMIDVETMETVTGRVIGLEDVLHTNAVLEDWLPRTDP